MLQVESSDQISLKWAKITTDAFLVNGRQYNSRWGGHDEILNICQRMSEEWQERDEYIG